MKKWLRKAVAGFAAAAVVFGSAGILPEGFTGLQGIVLSANAVDGVEINEANFPDAIFRNYVSENFDNSPKDGSLSPEEIAAVTYIWVNAKEISSLVGIEYFTALKELDCNSNQLTSLDVSKNTALTSLWCHFNNLKVLDVKNNTALTDLSCHGNELTKLDLSKNAALTYLECGFDFVNGDGTAVHAGNQLRSLDLSNNTALTELNCSNNQLTSLNVSNNTALTELNCRNNQLTSLNVSNNTELNNLIIEHNQLTSLDVSNNTELKLLDCMGNELTSLDTSSNTKLEDLVCQLNQLTSLDISKNTALKYLCCWGNQLKSLDVSKNTKLEYLYCRGCELSNLDVSKDTELKELDCSENQLTNLDVSKNTALTELSCYDNQLTSLDVSKNTALETLYCYQNKLTSLDLGNITNLKTLDCRFNQLSALDVSKNTALKGLYCYRNQLTKLDVSHNIALEWLSIGGNKLSSIDVSNNASLNQFIYYDDCVYETVMDTNTKSFDLSKMPDDFDVSKASEWKNAVYDSSTDTLKNITSDTVTYTYDIGRECNIAKSNTEEGYYIFRTDNKVGFTIKFTNYKTVKDLTVTAPKSAPKLYTGDNFDPTGYTLKVTYDDNSTETIDLTADMISGFDKTKPGNQALTVTYGGKTATFKVSVTELKATKLEVSKLPKTTYFLNEAIDLSEGTFSVTFNNGKTEEVPMSDSRVTVKGFDSTKTGSEKVTLGLLGKTVTVNMTIAVDPENAPVIMNGAGYENLTAAIAAINADVKAKTPKDSYTITVKGETLTEAKAVKFPAVKVTVTSEKPAVVKVPSVTASGNLTIENISFKTAKGDAAAVTAKKSLNVTNCTLGKTAVTDAANITDSILGAVTAKGELTVTAAEAGKTVMESLTVSAKNGTTKLNGDITITKNLTVSNDLIIAGNSEVGGKFTAKAALSINGFVVKNGK